MPSLTVENYAKAIYRIAQENEGKPTATGQVAAALGVSPGTVTSMLKTLSESNLVTYAPYEGVRLTAAGEALALRILRRHRLIELFLVKALNLSWDEVHDEAEHMEHAVSDWLVDRMDAMLNYPQTDPHGDPIPRRDGSIESPETRCLADCEPGMQFALVRVVDQSPEFLRFLSGTGIALGSAGQITANQPEAGVIRIQLPSGETTLGLDAARKLLVAPLTGLRVDAGTGVFGKI